MLILTVLPWACATELQTRVLLGNETEVFRTLHYVCDVVDGRTEFLHVQLRQFGLLLCASVSVITVVLLLTLLLILLPLIAIIVACIDDSV